MGADIHMFVEYKSKDDKYWFKAGKDFKDGYFDPKDIRLVFWFDN